MRSGRVMHQKRVLHFGQRTLFVCIFKLDPAPVAEAISIRDCPCCKFPFASGIKHPEFKVHCAVSDTIAQVIAVEGSCTCRKSGRNCKFCAFSCCEDEINEFVFPPHVSWRCCARCSLFKFPSKRTRLWLPAGRCGPLQGLVRSNSKSLPFLSVAT